MFLTTNDSLLDSLWVEKYRPHSINDIVLNDDQKQFLSLCLNKQDLPHSLFIGPPGGGKCHYEDELIDIYIED